MMYYLFILLMFFADQVSKFIVRENMVHGESVPILDNVFHITYVQNTGASFGIFSEHTRLLTYFTLLSLIALLGYVAHFKKKIEKGKKSKVENAMLISLAMILAGGFGNAVDRLCRGFVTDMFDFRIWPVFNVADIYICLGCAILLVCILKYDKKDKE